MSQITAETGFSPLLCVRRQDETADATTFEFRHLDNRPFEFQAGQFLTFAVDIADEQFHRAYSISSSPARPETVSVTIKRVEGGRVSNFLIDNLQQSHALQALAPAGEFTLQCAQFDAEKTPQLVLCCAGSGITPCMSIARWLLDSGAEVDIRFIYSARAGDDVIMAAELDQLAQHANVQLCRVLGQPARDGDYQGRLDQALFNDLLPELSSSTIFTCGPTTYMAAVENFARQRGFDMNRFHQESFAPASSDNGPAADAAQVQLTAVKSGMTVAAQVGENLLDAMEGAGVAMVAACRSGVCGACRCQVTSGEFVTESEATLSADDLAAGFVLACSATVQSDLSVEV